MLVILPSVKLMSFRDLQAEFFAYEGKRLTKEAKARRLRLAQEIDRRISG